jgi:hypothetical protein
VTRYYDDFLGFPQLLQTNSRTIPQLLPSMEELPANLKGKCNLGDTGVNMRIILKCVIMHVRVWT